MTAALGGCAAAEPEVHPVLFGATPGHGQSGAWTRVVPAQDVRQVQPTTAPATSGNPPPPALAPPATVAMQEAIAHARILLLRGRAQLDAGEYRAAARSFDRILQLADNAPSRPELAELREPARQGWFQARAGLGLGGADNGELPHIALARADIRRHLKRGARLFELGAYGACVTNMRRVLEIIDETPGLQEVRPYEREARGYIQAAAELRPGK